MPLFSRKRFTKNKIKIKDNVKNKMSLPTPVGKKYDSELIMHKRNKKHMSL